MESPPDITKPIGWFAVLLDSGDEVLADVMAGAFFGAAAPLYFQPEWRWLCVPLLVLGGVMFFLARRTARNAVRTRESARESARREGIKKIEKGCVDELIREKKSFAVMREAADLDIQTNRKMVVDLETELSRYRGN